MNEFLMEHGFINNLSILLSVVLLKIILSIFLIKEPLHLFRFFCDQLAKKVNNPNNGQNQQKIAGIVGMFTTLIPLIIIFWLFEDFIEVTWLWHAFLLYLALGSFGLTRISMKISKALMVNKTYEAKQMLQPLVLRETDKLSTLGISKTTIEMQLLQTIQQCFAVSFYFLLIGPLAALAYRLMLEMHYSWNIKKKGFSSFGKHINSLIQLLQWLPTRLFVFILLLGTIGQNFILFWRLINKHYFSLNNHIALYALSLALEKKLGGVAIYNNEKTRRVNVNDKAREPEPQDIILATKRINQVLYFSLTTIVLTVLLYGIVTIKV